MAVNLVSHGAQRDKHGSTRGIYIHTQYYLMCWARLGSQGQDQGQDAHLDAHRASDVVGEQRGQGQDSAVEDVGASTCGRCIAGGALVGGSCWALGEERRQELRKWGGR